jgi:demethylmacrocin O-methyltransferase
MSAELVVKTFTAFSQNVLEVKAMSICNCIVNCLRKWLTVEQREGLRKNAANIFGTFLSNNLTLLAKLYGTDKTGSHWYTPNYINHLRKYKNRRIKILEIGVGGYDNPKLGGNSLRMWKKYFPLGKIYGIDIYDKSALQERRKKNISGKKPS